MMKNLLSCTKKPQDNSIDRPSEPLEIVIVNEETIVNTSDEDDEIPVPFSPVPFSPVMSSISSDDQEYDLEYERVLSANFSQEYLEPSHPQQSQCIEPFIEHSCYQVSAVQLTKSDDEEHKNSSTALNSYESLNILGCDNFIWENTASKPQYHFNRNINTKPSLDLHFLTNFSQPTTISSSNSQIPLENSSHQPNSVFQFPPNILCQISFSYAPANSKFKENGSHK